MYSGRLRFRYGCLGLVARLNSSRVNGSVLIVVALSGMSSLLLRLMLMLSGEGSSSVAFWTVRGVSSRVRWAMAGMHILKLFGQCLSFWRINHGTQDSQYRKENGQKNNRSHSIPDPEPDQMVSHPVRTRDGCIDCIQALEMRWVILSLRQALFRVCRRLFSEKVEHGIIV